MFYRPWKLEQMETTCGRLSDRTPQRTRNPANTKHLYNIRTMLDQRRRRWADVVQMLYKCFVFVGKALITYLSLRSTLHLREKYPRIRDLHGIACMASQQTQNICITCIQF